MSDLKRVKKSRSENTLFNPYTNGISKYDLTYLASKRISKNKTIHKQGFSQKELFAA